MNDKNLMTYKQLMNNPNSKMFKHFIIYKELISKRISLNIKTIFNKNIINNKNVINYNNLINNKNIINNKNVINTKNVIYDYFKKNDDEKNRNLHRWCLSNKNKTKREINYPW